MEAIITETKRVAIYARVSTKNRQDPESQLLPLREYATARGFEISSEYVDIGITGRKDSRPELDRLMADAQKRRLDAVAVWKFDRFARSTRHLVTALEHFDALGVDFISLSESIDTSTPMGKMVFTVLAAVAELELSLIRERVIMGLRRAKAQGKKLGRPRGSTQDVERIQQLKGEGLSVRQIASNMKVSKSTVSRLLNTVP